MTVATPLSPGRRTKSRVLAHQQQHRKSWPTKNTAAAAGTGVQVVAVLFAVRIGYRLARTAGRLLIEATSPSVSDGEEQQALDGVDVFQADEFDASSSSVGGVSARDQWVLCPEPLPEVPEGARLMASEHLPISVYHFYEQYLSIETACLQDHHRSTGQFDFRASRWKCDGAGHFSRTFTFMQPKKGVCSANALCVQEQRFSVHAGGVLLLTTDMHMSGIPYADAFRVQGFWKAAPDATGLGCHVSVHVSVPFSKRCIVKGLITGTTFKDCQGFYSDFLAKVQNSIATELLPAAAAQAAAAEQLLGSSPVAAAAAALNSHLPQPPPLTVHTSATAAASAASDGAGAGAGAGCHVHSPAAAAAGGGHRQQQQQQGTSGGSSGGVLSPFAAVDAEVFVSTPMQAGGSAPQRGKQRHGSSSGSGGKAGSRHGWFPWPHRQQQQHKQQQREQQDAAATADAAGVGGFDDDDVLGVFGQQQHQQQWAALPSSPLPLRHHHHQQQQQQHHQHSRSNSRCNTPAGAPGAYYYQQQQQQHHQHTTSNIHSHGISGGVVNGHNSSGSWPLSRAVSVKPSFALPIDDLRLPNRVRPAEFITTAQAILLLLVLVVQLVTLYDNMAVRRLLAAAAAGAGPLQQQQ